MSYANPEDAKRYGREWRRRARAARPEMVEQDRRRSASAYQRRKQDPEWRERWNKESNERNFKRKYGITRRQKYELLSWQGGHCAICGDDKPTTFRPWHLDHDHATGRVRGVLCHYCNVAVGAVRDDPVIAMHVQAYLERGGACL